MSTSDSGGSTDGAACAADAATLHQLVDAYRVHHDRVVRLCRRYLDDGAAAEDATQETFMRAARHLHTVVESRRGAYLATVARNVCANELASRRRRRRTGWELRSAGTGEDPETIALDLRVISRVWARLSHRERVLFIYRFAGYSYEEIAERLRVSVSAVHMGLQRARHRVRHLLEGAPALLGALRVRRRATRLARSGGAAAGSMGGAVAAVVGVGARARLVIALSAVSAVATAVPVLAWPSGGAVAPGSGDAVAAPLSALPPDVAVTHLAVPPGAGSRTIYASGDQGGCSAPSCHVLYRSGDGGHSWERLPARGFAGGRVALPPSYPRDPAIFAAGDTGLQRSDDGGQSFRTVLGVRGPIAVDPRSPVGAARIVVGAAPLRLYTAGGTVSTGPQAPRGMQVDDVVFGVTGDHVLLSVSAAGRTSDRTLLLDCDLRVACHTSLSVQAPFLRLVRAPDGTVVAWSTRDVYVSRGGAPFAHTQHLAGGGIVTVAAGGGTIVGEVAAGGHGGALLRSSDGGATFVMRAPSTVLPRLAELAAAGTSTLLAAVETRDTLGWGLRCSTDGGTTWNLTC